ncbi:MAG: RNA pseudouridine synthase, partial [Deltaproteobacteria bacterium]|nr:RNA pseudouridine synthase [Deltaproteobacteria bacterium]
LAETKAHSVYSTSDRVKGMLSHTAYRVLKQSKNCALLEVDLLTGRKHQIRVHLAGIGHPIVGDRKYGKGTKDQKRLALHARSICFKHPFSGKMLSFETQVPPLFHTLVGIADTKTDTPGPPLF